MATLAYEHTPIVISSPWGECMQNSAADSTTLNANFVHPVTYICMSQSNQVMMTIESPRLGINLGTSSPQAEHANTNRDIRKPDVAYLVHVSSIAGVSLCEQFSQLVEQMHRINIYYKTS